MQRRDIALGVIIAIVWGLNFIAIKLGVQEMPPLMLAALRFLFVVFPAVFLLPRPPISWPWMIALGLFLNVGQFTFLFWGIKVGMPAGLASLVMQSQAFFTLFIAATWLDEKWKWNHLAGLAIAAGGMAAIGSQQNADMTIAGFVLVLSAAASWGVGNVIMRRATLGVPPYSAMSLIVWVGFVALLPLTALSLLIEGYEAWVNYYHTFTWVSVASVAYLAYFATWVGYGLWGKLMAKYPAAVVSPLALLVPVVGLSSSSIILGETISFWQSIGALLVMAGLLINVFGDRITFGASRQVVECDEGE